MKKQVFSFIITSVLIFVFCTCSDFADGPGTGTLSINFGVPAETGARAAWKPGTGLPPAALKELTHKVTLGNDTTVIEREYSKGAVSAKIAIAAGVWNVKVESFCYGVKVATADFKATIIAGRNNSFPVKMQQTDIAFYAVSTSDDMKNACIEISAFTENNCLILLTEDITMDETVNFGNNIGKVTVYGNKTISLGANGILLSVSSGEVVLHDARLKGKGNNNSPLVQVNSGGKFTMREKASVSGNSNSSGNGGGVSVNGGTFEMYENAIVSGNTAANGGGVNVTGGNFAMQDSATVSGNTATDNGGGVYTQGTFTMQGGATVFGNTADNNGGGVYAQGTFIMQESAKVSGNTVNGSDDSKSSGGGGVYVTGDNASFTMKGDASVSNNTANGNNYYSVPRNNSGGGGVCVFGSDVSNTPVVDFKMEGNASVSGNIFKVQPFSILDNDHRDYTGGGGVYVFGYNVRFTMSGDAKVSGNNSGSSGGGVAVRHGTFEMQVRATVSSNEAASDGGGVHVTQRGQTSVLFPAIFNMKGNTTVSGNTATNNGGGVAMGGSGKFQIEGGTVYGNKETNVDLRNTAGGANRAALSLPDSGDTADYGNFVGNQFIPVGNSPNLTSRDTTIKVVNGELKS